MLQIGTELELTNRFSRQTANFRLAWVRDQRGGELCENSVELALPCEEFWGCVPAHA